MKKIVLTLVALISLTSAAFAQVSTVVKPKGEVNAKSLEWKGSTTGLDVSYLTDGVNDNRAAFKIGEGYRLANLVPGLTSNFLGNTRLVSLLTVNASESGLAPRTSPALLFPEFLITKAATVQFGVAWKGFDLDKRFNSNEGAQLYARVKLSFPDFVNVLGL